MTSRTTISRRTLLALTAGSLITPQAGASYAMEPTPMEGGPAATGAGTTSPQPTAPQGSDLYNPYGDYLNFSRALLNMPVRGRLRAGSNRQVDPATNVVKVKQGEEYVFNPVTISHSGLQEFGYHALGRTDVPDALPNALAAANWLVANQDAPTGQWRYDYPFSVGGMSEVLRAGWASAMAQGQAICLLVRAWKHTGDTRYLETAHAGLASLTVDVTEGGLRTRFLNTELPFYEEYPTRPASYTLNGFIFCLLGLYDLATTGDEVARVQYQAGVQTLIAALPHYDAGTYSAYHLGHLSKAPRPIHWAARYHRLHCMQLGVMHSLSPHEVIDFYAKRWLTYPT